MGEGLTSFSKKPICTYCSKEIQRHRARETYYIQVKVTAWGGRVGLNVTAETGESGALYIVSMVTALL